MKNRNDMLGIIIYALVIFLLAVLQSTLGPRIGFFGNTPALLLALTAAAAFYDGEKTAMLVGLLSGFLLDALGGVGVSVLPLAYCLTGWFISLAVKRMAHDRSDRFHIRYLRYLIWLSAAVGIGMVITALCLLLTAGRVNIISTFVQILLPEALGSLVWGLPIGLVYQLLTINKD